MTGFILFSEVFTMSSDSDVDRAWKLLKQMSDSDFENLLTRLWRSSSAPLSAKKYILKTIWSPEGTWGHYYDDRWWLEAILRNRKNSFFSYFSSDFKHDFKPFSLSLSQDKNFFFKIFARTYFFAKSSGKKFNMIMFFIFPSAWTHRNT